MTYCAEISRSNPAAFLFLIDQSGSMSDKLPSERTKAQFVADVFNRTLATLITRCTKAEGTRDYFDIGVIGYSSNGICNALHGQLIASLLNSISAIEAAPLRIEDRRRKVDDGAGGIVEQSILFPVWLEPLAAGGTPMCEAIRQAAEALVTWCDRHPNSYPPTVLHITDGESTDGDPEMLAQQLQQIHTGDGGVLVFNLHVSAASTDAIKFPASDGLLPDAFAKLLFRMSSHLPPHLVQVVQDKGYPVGLESRGFMFNADAPEIADFFDIGTRAAQLR